MNRHFLFLLSSARAEGNSKALARAAAAGLATGAQSWLDLAALDLPPFRDQRPEAKSPTGDLDRVMAAMQRATDIVLVTPVYWYAPATPAKLLMDHWSGWLDHANTGFAQWSRDKRFFLITARADPDPTVTTPLEDMIRRSVTWLGMGWGGALHGIGDAPGEVARDQAALQKAQNFLTESHL